MPSLPQEGTLASRLPEVEEGKDEAGGGGGGENVVIFSGCSEFGLFAFLTKSLLCAVLKRTNRRIPCTTQKNHISRQTLWLVVGTNTDVVGMDTIRLYG